jgi:putative endonuclease
LDGRWRIKVACRKTYWVYILSNESRCLYVGVTNDLVRRLAEHRQRVLPGAFTARYNLFKLVYYEEYSDARSAVTRERQIKKWSRRKKTALIRAMNPGFGDLSQGWIGGGTVAVPASSVRRT